MPALQLIELAAPSLVTGPVTRRLSPAWRSTIFPLGAFLACCCCAAQPARRRGAGPRLHRGRLQRAVRPGPREQFRRRPAALPGAHPLRCRRESATRRAWPRGAWSSCSAPPSRRTCTFQPSSPPSCSWWWAPIPGSWSRHPFSTPWTSPPRSGRPRVAPASARPPARLGPGPAVPACATACCWRVAITARPAFADGSSVPIAVPWRRSSRTPVAATPAPRWRSSRSSSTAAARNGAPWSPRRSCRCRCAASFCRSCRRCDGAISRLLEAPAAVRQFLRLPRAPAQAARCTRCGARWSRR